MLDFVRQYYGEILEKTDDLRTSACCTLEPPPRHVRDALTRVHDEVQQKYYGCGLVLPEALEGCRVLDLGCGSGRDCFLLAQLVGANGRVFGVDMTEAQLDVGRRHLAYHAQQFGFAESNVELHLGYIEDLASLPIEAGSLDVIVSNCVVNLSPDKAAVLQGAWNLLKPGGEIYFADVYADRRIPQSVASDPVLYGECLGGALYWNDFLTLARQAGFTDPRLVTDRAIDVEDERLSDVVGPIRFYSATYRLFKLPNLETACEDYGQAVIYKGSIAHHPDRFVLDNHHAMDTGRVFPVCGNTFDMLHDSRLAPHFDFVGDRSRHYGIFPDCGTPVPFAAANDDGSGEAASGACC